MLNKYGIIIAVENYLNSKEFSKVKYAIDDAIKVKEFFEQKLSIPSKNIRFFEDKDFSIDYDDINCIDEIKYFLNIEDDMELYFYYVGHGFLMDGENRITAYNSSLDNIKNTTMNFEDLFLGFFKKSNGRIKRCIAFIDACANIIPDSSRGITARGIDLSRSKSKLKELTNGYAIYMACSPTETSNSSDDLGNGIWTWYLCKAFNGDKKACNSEGDITYYSLKKYLEESVKEYCTNCENNIVQTPYSVISTSGDDSIIRIENTNSNVVEEMNQKEFYSFKDECLSATSYLYNACSLLGYKYGIGNFEVNNFQEAEAVCEFCDNCNWGIPKDWEKSLKDLGFYYEAYNRDDAFKCNLSYYDKKAIIDNADELISFLYDIYD